jgi:1-acyl-sn-glycerol-3-phosphate acyltransferase
MWALAVVTLAAGVVWLRWLASGQPLVEFLFLNLCRWYTVVWHRASSNGLAPFPARGPVLLVSNHTCSADPPFLLGVSKRPIGFVVAREHFNLNVLIRRLLSWLRCVPATRNGRDLVAARTALRYLQEGRIVGIFPEGNLSGVGRNRLKPARAGAALLALRSRAPVFPVYIAGGPRTYRLVQSWLRPSRVPVRVIFGPPIDLSAYYGLPINRQLLEQVMEHLMAHVAALRPPTRKTRTVVPAKERLS